MDRETVDEIKRHFGVVIEGVDDRIAAVAEGLQSHREEFQSFRGDVAREFEETRALVRLSSGELDRRVRTLETEMADFRERLERVEGHIGG
jgi:uncharacterized protein YceH (UPF0502 family)